MDHSELEACQKANVKVSVRTCKGTCTCTSCRVTPHYFRFTDTYIYLTVALPSFQKLWRSISCFFSRQHQTLFRLRAYSAHRQTMLLVSACVKLPALACDTLGDFLISKTYFVTLFVFLCLNRDVHMYIHVTVACLLVVTSHCCAGVGLCLTQLLMSTAAGQKTIESVTESILHDKLTSAERRIEHLSDVRTSTSTSCCYQYFY